VAQFAQLECRCADRDVHASNVTGARIVVG
jgi:hypothetical protein